MAPDHVSSCKLPVIVFSHGYNDIRTSYTALNCDLASHGYLMACVEHRDRSACTTVRKIPKPGAPGEYEDKWIPAMYDEDEETGIETKQQQVCMLHIMHHYGKCTHSKPVICIKPSVTVYSARYFESDKRIGSA